MYKILIVEDDATIADILGRHLEKWGFQSVPVTDFSAVDQIFLKENPSLVLMDIVLPFFNGYYWCGKIRQVSKVPMIFISSKNTPMDMVMAVNMGADDYITKPFDLDVVTAKVAALLRRAYDYHDEIEGISFKDAFLNFKEAAVYYNDRRIELTKNEYKIIRCLLESRGSIVSRDVLMQKLWDSDCFIDDNTLTVNVARLRKKLDDAGIGRCIGTKKGLGYMMKDA